MVTCRLARPERAARCSVVRSESSASASARSAANARGRLLERLGTGADGQVPDRREQAVRAEHPDEPRPVGDRVLAGGVQPGQRVEQPVLGLGHHPAQVLLGARRWSSTPPRPTASRAVGLAEALAWSRAPAIDVLVLHVGDPVVEPLVHGDVERRTR